MSEGVTGLSNDEVLMKQRIAQLRVELAQLARASTNLNCPAVLDKSREIDTLIVDYYRIVLNKNTPRQANTA